MISLAICLLLVGIADLFLISGCLHIVPIRRIESLASRGLSKLAMQRALNDCRLVLTKMTRLVLAVVSVCYTVLFPLCSGGSLGKILLSGMICVLPVVVILVAVLADLELSIIKLLISELHNLLRTAPMTRFMALVLPSVGRTIVMSRRPIGSRLLIC